MAITLSQYNNAEGKKYSGVSTDQKPTENVGVNDVFFELDTGKFYYFDGTEWGEIPAGGSTPSLQDKSVSITANGDTTVQPDEGYDGMSSVALSVNVQAEPVPENDVEFIDYDGTILYSYTAEQFLALTEMPANPTHEGLTAQGWNWTLADAKEYVGDYGGLVIGQMYITDDGKTRIYISLPEGRTSPYLGICPNGTINIDWGDGTNEDVTGTSVSTIVYTQHNYASAGDYVIKLTVVSGTWGITGNASYNYSVLLTAKESTAAKNTVYQSCINKIELGSGINTIGGYGLGYLYELKLLTLPSNITQIGEYGLYYSISLQALVLPPIVALSRAFSASRIKRVSIGRGARIGVYGFANCGNLQKAMISNQYGNAVDSYCFSTCTALKIAVLPDTIYYNINYEGMFLNCYSLKKVYFSQTASTLWGSGFKECYSLTELEVPSSVSSIGGMALQNCYALVKLKFARSTPASVSASSAFQNLPTDCKIYVPSGSLSAYTTATNYPDPNTYTYVEY